MRDEIDADMTDESWVLAIDFGTSYTVAASRRGDRPAEVIEIDGERRVPSVMLLDEAGDMKVGRAAETLASTSPGRVLRAPKSRLGDPAPVVLGGRPHSISDLVAALLRYVHDAAVGYHGSEPVEVRLTHPATWSGPRRQQLLTAAEAAGMPDATLVPEPVAAAIAYADDVTISQGAHVIVYDLGGGTFDTAALQAAPNGFLVMGRPGGDPQLGGELFDELLANAIGETLDPDVYEQLQLADDLLWTQAAIGLRREARRVKEALSSHAYADVLLGLPGGLIQQRVERSELHRVIEPYVAESVDVMQQTASGAGLTADDLASIYLVGGASRSPLVEEMVREAYPTVEISRRGDPKGVVAIGATHPLATPTSLAQRSSLDRASTLDSPGPPPAGPIPPPAGADDRTGSTVADEPTATIVDGAPATVIDSATVVDNGTVLDGAGSGAFPPPTGSAPVSESGDAPTNRTKAVVGVGIAALLGLGAIGLATRDSPDTAAPDVTVETTTDRGASRATIAAPATSIDIEPAPTSSPPPVVVDPTTTLAPTTLAPETTAPPATTAPPPEPPGLPSQAEVDAAMFRASDLDTVGWVDLADDDPILNGADEDGFCGPEPVVGRASSTTTALQNATGTFRYLVHTIDVYDSAESAAETFRLGAEVYANCDVSTVDLDGVAYDAFISADPFDDSDAGLVCSDESIFIGTLLSNGPPTLPTLSQVVTATRCGSNISIVGVVVAGGLEQTVDIDYAQASTVSNLRVNNLPGSN